MSGTTDGQAGDLLDIVCTRGDGGFERTVANVAVRKDGTFDAMVPLNSVKPAACVLRAVPYSTPGRTSARSRARSWRSRTSTRSPPPRPCAGANTVALDYEVETGHRRGHATVTAGAGLKAHFGVQPTLERNVTRTWDAAARIDG